MQSLLNTKVQDFCATFLVAIGLPFESRDALLRGLYFVGAHGTSWRLVITDENGEFVVRPELILPLSVLKMQGHEILNMFGIQAYLFTELKWWLSANDKGFIQITSINCSSDPHEAIAMLDTARVIAPTVMQYIVIGKLSELGQPNPSA